MIFLSAQPCFVYNFDDSSNCTASLNTQETTDLLENLISWTEDGAFKLRERYETIYYPLLLLCDSKGDQENHHSYFLHD